MTDHAANLREIAEAFGDAAEHYKLLAAADEIDLLRKERDAVLEESLERAAKELPEWCDVSIRVERGAATVSWSDEHGNEYDIDGADQTIAEQVNAAIDAALKGKGIIYFTPALIINGIFIVHNVLDSLDNLCHDSVVGSTA